MAKRLKAARPGLLQFGARVLSIREARGYTHRQVAQGGGLSVTQVQRLESGSREPRYSTVLALARGLCVDAAVLVSDKYPPDVPLVRRQPPTSWTTLNEAFGVLQAVATEMVAYEAAKLNPVAAPEPDDPPHRKRRRRPPR